MNLDDGRDYYLISHSLTFFHLEGEIRTLKYRNSWGDRKENSPNIELPFFCLCLQQRILRSRKISMEMVKYWDAIKYSQGKYFQFSVMLQMCIRPWNHSHTSLAQFTTSNRHKAWNLNIRHQLTLETALGRDLFIRGHFLWPACTYFSPSEQYWKKYPITLFLSTATLDLQTEFLSVGAWEQCVPPGHHDSFASPN